MYSLFQIYEYCIKFHADIFLTAYEILCQIDYTFFKKKNDFLTRKLDFLAQQYYFQWLNPKKNYRHNLLDFFCVKLKLIIFLTSANCKYIAICWLIQHICFYYVNGNTQMQRLRMTVFNQIDMLIMFRFLINWMTLLSVQCIHFCNAVIFIKARAIIHCVFTPVMQTFFCYHLHISAIAC